MTRISQSRGKNTNVLGSILPVILMMDDDDDDDDDDDNDG